MWFSIRATVNCLKISCNAERPCLGELGLVERRWGRLVLAVGGGRADPPLPPQGFADGEGGAGHEHHPQHLQPHPQVPGAADRPSLEPPAGGAGAPELRGPAAVLQHLQVLLPLPLQRYGVRPPTPPPPSRSSPAGPWCLRFPAV